MNTDEETVLKDAAAVLKQAIDDGLDCSWTARSTEFAQFCEDAEENIKDIEKALAKGVVDNLLRKYCHDVLQQEELGELGGKSLDALVTEMQ
jgi:hypothetical protein